MARDQERLLVVLCDAELQRGERVAAHGAF
jgi:hypothetical protein